MIKVVINDNEGGSFDLSDKAIEACIRNGMKVTTIKGNKYKDENADFVDLKKYSSKNKYQCIKDYRNEFRSNPTLIKVIESLGPEANGRLSDLKIIEIPFDSVQGWFIDNNDGLEQVSEIHRSWS